MKNICVLLFLSLVPMLVMSQEEEKARNNEFRVGFFQFFAGTFHLEYGRRFGENKSVVLAVAPQMLESDDKTKTGIASDLRLFWNVPLDDSGKSRINLYYGPYLRFRYADMSKTYTSYDYNGYYTTTTENTCIFTSGGGGIIVGLDFFSTNGLSLAVEAGGGMRYIISRSGNTEPDQFFDNLDIFIPAYSGIFPRANVTFGVKF